MPLTEWERRSHPVKAAIEQMEAYITIMTIMVQYICWVKHVLRVTYVNTPLLPYIVLKTKLKQSDETMGRPGE